MEERKVIALTELSMLAGGWLIVSPFILAYVSSINMRQQIGLGVLIIVLGIIWLGIPRMVWLSWVNVIAGVWLVFAPFVLSSPALAARWNEVIMGVIIATLGGRTAYIHATVAAANAIDKPH